MKHSVNKEKSWGTNSHYTHFILKRKEKPSANVARHPKILWGVSNPPLLLEKDITSIFIYYPQKVNNLRTVSCGYSCRNCECLVLKERTLNTTAIFKIFEELSSEKDIKCRKLRKSGLRRDTFSKYKYKRGRKGATWEYSSKEKTSIETKCQGYLLDNKWWKVHLNNIEGPSHKVSMTHGTK